MNEEGLLEIFEAYESDGGESPASKKVSAKPSSVQYVEFDFGKTKSFATAHSPADLRRVIDAQV